MLGSHDAVVQGSLLYAGEAEAGPRALSPLESALDRARRCLLAQQKPDGHWVGELQGDTILESEYILLMAFLGREKEEHVAKAARYILKQQMPEGGWSNYPGGPAEISVSVKAYFALKLAGHDPEAEYMRRARAVIRALGGAVRCNSFTKFYLALLGQFPYDNCPAVPPEMIFLPRWAYVNLYAMSSWTRTIVVPLSIFYAYKPVRHLPPEQGIGELFLDDPFTPLWSHPPTRRWLTWHNFFLVMDQAIKWVDRRIEDRGSRIEDRGSRIEDRGSVVQESASAFHPPSSILHPLSSIFRLPFSLMRKAAVKRAEAWIKERFADSDGLGAIFPPMIYTVIVLRCLGYSDDSPEMVYALQQLDGLMIEEDDTLRLQPCLSPVWDTALSLIALCEWRVASGEWRVEEGEKGRKGEREKISQPAAQARVFAQHSALSTQHSALSTSSSSLQPPVSSLDRAVRWLLDREVRRPGDWSKTNPRLEPGGWFFEYRNGFYPDVDDTAMVLMALAKTVLSAEWKVLSAESDTNRSPQSQSFAKDFITQHSALSTQHFRDAQRRGLRWLLAMQNRDGGWGAFDRDINRELLTQVPFADHNAMLDPSCPDITSRVLEALGHYEFGVEHPQAQRALAFLEATQECEGCWPGRWGVNYVYGTWQVLQGLHRIGYDMQRPMVRRAVAWLKQVHHFSGGWGESCRSYDDPSLKGQGEPTASQTAWALLGLLAAGEHDSPEVQAGVGYLLATQQPNGNWREEPFTGTGFPKVFYLKYHLYSLYFPLMALARYFKEKGKRKKEKGISD